MPCVARLPSRRITSSSASAWIGTADGWLFRGDLRRLSRAIFLIWMSTWNGLLSVFPSPLPEQQCAPLRLSQEDHIASELRGIYDTGRAGHGWGIN